MKRSTVLFAAALLLAGASHAAPGANNSGVPPMAAVVVAPAAAPARAPRPYALVASPTLPCAPAYCPRQVRVRADRY